MRGDPIKQKTRGTAGKKTTGKRTENETLLKGAGGKEKRKY